MNDTDSKSARNNKLEYFLKKNLHPNVYSNIRWYGPVIFRTGNNLSYKQVIVSGNDVYLTETPPQTLTHLFHSSFINDVQLVHDLPEFLRGGVRDQTTHVTIRYLPGRTNSLGKTNKTRRRGSHRSVPIEKPSTSSINEENEDVDVIDYGRGQINKWRNYLQQSPTGSPSELSPQNETTSVCSDPSTPSLHLVSIDGLSTNSDESCSQTRRKDWHLSPPLDRSSTNGILSSHDEESTHQSLPANHMLVHPTNGAKSPLRSRSPDMDRESFAHRSMTPTIADLLSRVSGHKVPRSMTPDGVFQSRMHRSVSALENYHRSSLLHLDLPNRSKSVLDKPSILGQPPRRTQSLNFSDVIDGIESDKEVHLYTLSTSTLLFHLLHSLWVASCLKKTLNEGRMRYPQHEFLQEKCVDEEFNQIQNELLIAMSIEDQFSTLQELQQEASKYPTIRRLFWKDPNMLKNVMNILKQYSKSSNGTNFGSKNEDDLQRRQDELEVLALALETLATCLQETQRCPFKMKALQHNKSKCLKELIKEILVVPEVPSAYKLTCARWLTDFRELSSNAWENLPESELLRLVQEVIHTSVGCLYELLSSANELTWISNPHTQNNEIGLNLTTLLQHAPVEAWLSYSIPQLLVLVHPERVGESNGSGACLTHQYCSVLNTLLHHSPQALHYCTTHYAEELRYYLQESVVSCRLGKSCPIRSHTLKLVRTLAQLVISKNALRSR